MAATIGELYNWFAAGVKDNRKVMLVICDTFDHEDYPVYYDSISEAKDRRDNPQPMERLMESYDLTKDPEPQIQARIANCLY